MQENRLEQQIQTEEPVKAAPFLPTKFRVWVIFNPPADAIYIPVHTMDEVMVIFALIAEISKLQNDDESNVSGLEYLDSDNDWVEFYDKEGEDVEHYWEEYTENKDNPIRFHKRLHELVGV